MDFNLTLFLLNQNASSKILVLSTVDIDMYISSYSTEKDKAQRQLHSIPPRPPHLETECFQTGHLKIPCLPYLEVKKCD